MFRKIFFTIVFLSFFCLVKPAFATYDPQSVPNNKFGIHILFPNELADAAKLVNTNGGDWGYVMIPIQSGDKDIEKWQKFMDDAKALHLIPIIRLATEGDYFNTKVWRKPVLVDVLDFANFLSSLDWPTKNRYIVVYNETNRGDEWGGTPNASEYAELLSYTVSVFKSRSQDFFIISSGFDNASINGNGAMNEYNYMTQMNDAVPGIFNQVEGLGSHSYPNPGFSSPPTLKSRESIAGFLYEETFVKQMSNRDLPVFITETGWSDAVLPKSVIASYFEIAYNSVWDDPHVVAVTPFLLRAGSGPFTQFSFLDNNGQPTDFYTKIASMQKIKGLPQISFPVLAVETKMITKSFPKIAFAADNKPDTIQFMESDPFKTVLKWLLHW